MKKSPRLESKTYFATRELLRATLPGIGIHVAARLSRAAVTSGLALIDNDGRAHLVSEKERNHDSV